MRHLETEDLMPDLEPHELVPGHVKDLADVTPAQREQGSMEGSMEGLMEGSIEGSTEGSMEDSFSISVSTTKCVSALAVYPHVWPWI